MLRSIVRRAHFTKILEEIKQYHELRKKYEAHADKNDKSDPETIFENFGE